MAVRDPDRMIDEEQHAALSPWVDVMTAQTATIMRLAEAIEALEARAEASDRSLAALAAHTDTLAGLLSGRDDV